jgi:hypothetical protein
MAEDSGTEKPSTFIFDGRQYQQSTKQSNKVVARQIEAAVAVGSSERQGRHQETARADVGVISSFV